MRECSEIIIASGSLGVSDKRVFKWRTNYNGWRLILLEIERLNAQVASGSKNISADTLGNVIGIITLLDKVFRECPRALQVLGQDVSRGLSALIEKFVHIPNPPLLLLAGEYMVEKFGNVFMTGLIFALLSIILPFYFNHLNRSVPH